LYFSKNYYFYYGRYIDLKKRIRVLSFWNIINVFELVGYLEKFGFLNWDQAFLNFVKRTKHCLIYDFIEYELLTLTEIKLNLKLKIHLYFSTNYYFYYVRYIDLKKRIRVLSFWNIINVFELVGYLEKFGYLN
jgi:hypothetical protein